MKRPVCMFMTIALCTTIAQAQDPISNLLEPPSPDLQSPSQTDHEALACLQQKVTISNESVSPAALGNAIRIEVSNKLNWPISAITFKYSINGNSRNVPWVSDTINIKIDGGIEPNETRIIEKTIYELSSEAKGELSVLTDIVDVEDQDGAQLVGSFGLFGWSAERSDRSC